METVKWVKIIQEDECAPDARETFNRDFEKIVGVSPGMFRRSSVLTKIGVCLVWEKVPWRLSLCADDPYYLLEKAE